MGATLRPTGAHDFGGLEISSDRDKRVSDETKRMNDEVAAGMGVL
jgi:hypothetical protein